MKYLNEYDLDFWDQNGYIVINDAVPPQYLKDTEQAIWDFLDADANLSDSWYNKKVAPQGFVELYHHQSLWNNRQYPKIHQIFADLWNTEILWVSLDRVNMKPPNKVGWIDDGFIHWDVDSTQLPIPFGLQGVLYLTDTTTDQGCFQCVPGFHKRIEEWAITQPQNRNPRVPDTTGMLIKKIEGKAGDLIIWHQALPHGNSANTSSKPRLAQYLTMFPQNQDEVERQLRVLAWKKKLPVKFWRYVPGQPFSLAELQSEPGSTANLTELGEKLLGLKSW